MLAFELFLYNIMYWTHLLSFNWIYSVAIIFVLPSFSMKCRTKNNKKTNYQRFVSALMTLGVSYPIDKHQCQSCFFFFFCVCKLKKKREKDSDVPICENA